MSRPCESCAFTPGSAANLEPHNHVKGILCTLGPSPFFCHQNIDWQNTPSRMSGFDFRAKGFVICEGWKREVRTLAEAGYYKEAPIIKRGLGEAGLVALEIFVSTSGDESEDGREDHDWAKTLLKGTIRKLVKMARPFRQVIRRKQGGTDGKD